MKFWHITLSEISQSQKYYMIPLIWEIYSSSIYRDKKENGGCQGIGKDRDGELLFTEYGVSVFQIEKSSGDGQ